MPVESQAMRLPSGAQRGDQSRQLPGPRMLLPQPAHAAAPSSNNVSAFTDPVYLTPVD